MMAFVCTFVNRTSFLLVREGMACSECHQAGFLWPAARNSDLCRSGGWSALTALHWHPALIVLAAFVAIGVITAILTALASALPRTTTAIGVLYCTAMYGLAAYAITNNPIWTTVIALLTAGISGEPVAAFI
jgi:hypothetical protein